MHYVSKYGWAGWQANNFSLKEACGWNLEHEVNKKHKHLLPHSLDVAEIYLLSLFTSGEWFDKVN